MPDKRKHRGAHPQDDQLFNASKLPDLRSAVADLSWLLSHGYAQPSSSKIVGDRYGLTRRQRLAVVRSACSDGAKADRQAKRIQSDNLVGRDIAVDGYNLLITIESALAGGVIFVGRDGCCRDLASIHGSYRTMSETVPALELIGRVFTGLGVASVLWLLDSPVSNSGRLRSKMLHLAESHNWPWAVELDFNPDNILIQTDRVVVTSDSVILDGCSAWTNLNRHIIDTNIPDAWLIEVG